MSTSFCQLSDDECFHSPWSFSAFADDFHIEPYDYLFGNHIDSHQETRLRVNNGQPVSLRGFLYIIFTGETKDMGLPIARHPSGDECEDDDDSDDCVVGWDIKALAGDAKFLYHSGINGNDQPVWMVNRVDIPQPDSYTHFHWITEESTDLRADDVPEECDVEMAGQLEAEVKNFVYPGWFLQIKAVEEFACEHGGEIVPVRL